MSPRPANEAAGQPATERMPPSDQPEAVHSSRRRPAGRRAVWRREDGQALVEFAVVLPVLLLVLTAILKFGLMFNNYITLTDAVRSGARALALSRGEGVGIPPCSQAINQTISSAAPAVGLTPASITNTFSGTENCTTGDGVTWLQGDQATMTATYGCDLTIFGINFFPGCTLTASATEAIE